MFNYIKKESALNIVRAKKNEYEEFMNKEIKSIEQWLDTNKIDDNISEAIKNSLKNRSTCVTYDCVRDYLDLCSHIMLYNVWKTEYWCTVDILKDLEHLC